MKLNQDTMTMGELMQTCKVLDRQARIQMRRLIREQQRGRFISTGYLQPALQALIESYRREV